MYPSKPTIRLLDCSTGSHTKHTDGSRLTNLQVGVKDRAYPYEYIQGPVLGSSSLVSLLPPPPLKFLGYQTAHYTSSSVQDQAGSLTAPAWLPTQHIPAMTRRGTCPLAVAGIPQNDNTSLPEISAVKNPFARNNSPATLVMRRAACVPSWFVRSEDTND